MIKQLFIILLLSSCIFAANNGIQNRELPQSEMKSQNEHIAKLAASELSKTLPQQIDKFTKLIDIKADKATIIYIYEINIAPKSDATVKSEDHTRMKEAVTLGTCRSSRRFLEADILIRYIYTSATTQAQLFKFDVNQQSCFQL
ncbi:MAG: hypothetical protein ACI9TV_003049 [Sulfurimonas sp.]|jgi:hypothetical protein|uniref:hypothetical protein n=1 Tax=Sulfurimonas sp. TaxID=2022749 RepID=UPI0039E4CD00